MSQVVNVKFRNGGKVYYFAPEGIEELRTGVPVIVDTVKGQEYAICSSKPYELDDARIPSQLRPVVRIATNTDRAVVDSYIEQERAALTTCKRKVAEHGLDMKLINADFSFDGTKITFHFTADGRVDFRELVRDLGSSFHKRIELRQIGIRDGARLLGGIGPCGREFCCSTYLNEFQAISVKMAKTQSLSLNPVKISGACGNLMCCLKHEEEAYEDLQKDAPTIESVVDTPLGKGLVTDVNLLRHSVKVRIETEKMTTMKTYPYSQIGYTVNGEYRPPLEVPAVIEKAPAFEPPKYEPLNDAKPGALPSHERTREHNTPPRGQNSQNRRGDRRGNGAPRNPQNGQDRPHRQNGNSAKSEQPNENRPQNGNQSGRNNGSKWKR